MASNPDAVFFYSSIAFSQNRALLFHRPCYLVLTGCFSLIQSMVLLFSLADTFWLCGLWSKTSERGGDGYNHEVVPM